MKVRSYLPKIIYWNLILLTFLLNKLGRVSMLRVVLIVLLLVLFIETQFAICISKAPFIGCLETEREALIDFKTGLYDPQNLLSSWKGSNCCQWRGVHCDNTTGAVIALDLHNPTPWEDADSSVRYLSGEIRPSLQLLKSLKHLDLSINTFTGIPIPEFFGSLKNLQYLNLSYAGFSGAIPPSLGNLSSLQYLDVSSKSFYQSVDNLEWLTGTVSLEYLNMNGANLSMLGPDWIEKLNKLSSLTELHLSDCGLSGSIPSLTLINFTSLAVIELDSNRFHSEIPNWLLNISSLVTVSISYSGLYGRIPLGFSELPSLKFLNLSKNYDLTASCSQLFRGRWQKLEVILLSSTNLHGRLPASFGNITTLTFFNLSSNNVQGGIPSSMGRLSNLNHFDLSSNNLTGTLPEWLGQLENLVVLNLFNNSLHGPIPSSLGSLPNISILSLGYNKLNGTLPDSLGKLSELSLFDVSFNHLTGIVTETHFAELNKLKSLRLCSNSLVLNVNSSWVPPFQVHDLLLRSCHLGPSFPSWFKSQKDVQYLDFSNASVSGSIPQWFWKVSSNFVLLNVSSNQLRGQLPSPLNLASYSIIDFSSNFFEGPIPLPTIGVDLLDLSNNTFSGTIPRNIGETMPYLFFLSLSGNNLTGEIPASIGKLLNIAVIDLSSNMLNGSIPYSIENCASLRILDLSKNNLSGNIPNSLGQLTQLHILHLSDNKLSGELPRAFQNLSNLETLDLGNNRLTGNIPPWIGQGYANLRIFSLRSNEFFGELPSLLSNLSSLHILDLAGNQLNGTIPACFGDFKAMAQVQKVNHYLFYGFPKTKDYDDRMLYQEASYYEEALVVNSKGSSRIYTKTLSLVISIDLSGNKLSGDLPKQLTKLSGLVVLNLSRNHISGHILDSISKLQQLQSLDLSSNRISGPLPPSLSSLSFLGYLNLSNNNFSGMIPYTGHTMTFDASTFVGNPGLCGAPLAVSCPDDKGRTSEHDEDGGGNDFIDNWFYLSVGLGFAAGILAPFFLLATRKSWCEAYFNLVDEVTERIRHCYLH